MTQRFLDWTNHLVPISMLRAASTSLRGADCGGMSCTRPSLHPATALFKLGAHNEVVALRLGGPQHQQPRTLHLCAPHAVPPARALAEPGLPPANPTSASSPPVPRQETAGTSTVISVKVTHDGGGSPTAVVTATSRTRALVTRAGTRQTAGQLARAPGARSLTAARDLRASE